VKTRPVAGRTGVRMLVGTRISLFSKRPGRLWGAPSLLFSKHGRFFLGVKRPRRETDHSPPFEVKNEWSYASTPPYVFMA